MKGEKKMVNQVILIGKLTNKPILKKREDKVYQAVIRLPNQDCQRGK